MNPWSGKIKGASNLNRLSNLSNRFKHWDLLFIDEHGKTISFKQVRGVLIVFAFLILALTAISIYLFYREKTAFKKIHTLQSTLTLSQQDVKTLQEENHRLMIQLAEAQSKVPKQSASIETKSLKNSEEPVLIQRPAQAAPQKKEKSTVEKAALPIKPEAVALKSAAPLETQKEEEATVFDFLGYLDAESNTLNARFILKNDTQDGSSLSGYVFVVMKDRQNDQHSWVCLPSVELISGQPARVQAGQSFKIRNFMTMELMSKTVQGPKAYNKATVLIFAESGKLIYDKTFRVNIDVPEIAEEPDRPQPAEIAPPDDTAPTPEMETDPGETVTDEPEHKSPEQDLPPTTTE